MVVLVVLGAILVGGAVTPEELEDFRTDKGHYRAPEAPQVGANRAPRVVLLGFLGKMQGEQEDFELESASAWPEEVVPAVFVQVLLDSGLWVVVTAAVVVVGQASSCFEMPVVIVLKFDIVE